MTLWWFSAACNYNRNQIGKTPLQPSREVLDRDVTAETQQQEFDLKLDVVDELASAVLQMEELLSTTILISSHFRKNNKEAQKNPHLYQRIW